MKTKHQNKFEKTCRRKFCVELITQLSSRLDYEKELAKSASGFKCDHSIFFQILTYIVIF